MGESSLPRLGCYLVLASFSRRADLLCLDMLKTRPQVVRVPVEVRPAVFELLGTPTTRGLTQMLGIPTALAVAYLLWRAIEEPQS